MIQTRGLTKRFGAFLALDHVELEVPRGAVYGLVGPNGAGKTTAIQHLAGVMWQDSGEVLVEGQPVFENPGIKQRMVHIPDDLYFFPSAGILDMKRFYQTTYPVFDQERFEKLKAAFPLELKRPVRRFSRGMQKQAAIWLALCCRPDYILLDEPMDGLDPVMRRTVWNLMKQDIEERGVTVFVSSHNLRELEDVCTHVGIMHQGKMLLQRDLSQFQAGVAKLQVVFEGEPPAAMEALDILHASNSGRAFEYILRGDVQELTERVKALGPVLVDVLPLSLEEIFIYELGGMGYAEILI